jgi:hypothetical protein
MLFLLLFCVCAGARGWDPSDATSARVLDGRTSIRSRMGSKRCHGSALVLRTERRRSAPRVAQETISESQSAHGAAHERLPELSLNNVRCLPQPEPHVAPRLAVGPRRPKFGPSKLNPTAAAKSPQVRGSAHPH